MAEPYSAILLIFRCMSISVEVQIIKWWINMKIGGQIFTKVVKFLQRWTKLW